MLTKPVAVVLLLSAIVIAAFVGGYVAQQVRVPVSAENQAPGVDGATPVTPVGETAAGGGPAASGGAAAAGRGIGGGGGSRLPRPGGAGQIPRLGGGAAPGASLPSAAGVPGVPAGGSPTASGGLGTPPPPKELTVPAGTIIGIDLGSPLSSETAKVEDPVEATISKDVPIGGYIAIPAGTRVLGSVMLVDQGGMKKPSKLGVRLHTLVPAFGPEVALSIEPLIHQVEPTAEKSTKTIGIGAAVGAGLGWLLGGKEGMIKGGAAGAGGGTAAAMLAKPKPAELPKGAQALVKLQNQIVVAVR
jgi:hypothetical protein